MSLLRTVVLLAVTAAGAAAQVASPLEASLRRGVSEASFYVDQPAYVAVFEVLPGQGVQQLFPRSSWQAARPVEPGEYLLSRPFRSQYGYYGWNWSMPVARPMWMVDNGGQIISYYYTTGWTGSEAGWGAATIPPVRTLLLVASRSPLRRVSTPDAARSWLQNVVGFRAISSAVIAPSDMLTDIVDAVLPLGLSVDDVVVDVLEVTDDYNAYGRYAGQSISFYCPYGAVNIPASFFFASGIFYCPSRTPYDNGPSTPATPAGGDTVRTEQLDMRPRRASPKYNVDESAVPLRRGVIATPVTPSLLPEEGVRPYRPQGGARDEGVRPYGRGVGTTDVGPRGTITVGVPIDPVGVSRYGATPFAEAYVPRAVRNVPTDGALGYAGRYDGRSSAGWTGSSASGARSQGSANSGASTVSTPTSTSSAPSASQAQGARSAASREAVSAARPAPSKPDPR